MASSFSHPQPLPPRGERVPPQRRLEAAAALLRTGPPEAESFLRALGARDASAGAFWAVESPAGGYEAAVLGVLSPGRTVMCFASPPSNRGDVPVLAGVIQRAATELAAEGVAIAQVLLATQDRLSSAAFEAAGFWDLAILQYMERSATAFPSFDREVLQCVPLPQCGDDLLAEVLIQTYEASLDCPELHGLRTTPDIIAGHRAMGRYDAQLWSVIHVANRPAGVLLLSCSHEAGVAELVYLGLVPWARGRGLGRAALLHAIRESRRVGCQRISLAVDRNNAPAIRLYRSLGFRSLQRRRAMIRQLSTSC